MSKLTDEQIYRITQQLWGAGACHSEYQKFARAIESAATEPLLQRIAELEETNAQLREQNMEVDKACAELERQLEEARKDAERLDYIQKNARNDPKMDGNHVWWPTTFNQAQSLKGPTIRAAIDAAMQNDKPVGVVFQKGQS